MNFSVQARAFFEALPANKRPIDGTPGNRYWQKQKIRQLPGHDLDLIYCNELSNEECKQMEMFVKIRKEKFLGKGKIVQKQSEDKTDWVCYQLLYLYFYHSVHYFFNKLCGKCKVLFKVGEVAVTADRIPSTYYHPGCFNCSECNEVLVELIYFEHDGKLYCGRHHAEKLKPRCGACDEVSIMT